MMDDKMMKRMFDMLKTSSDFTMGTISMWQNQTERMTHMMFEHYDHLNTEGRKYLDEWMNKTSRNYDDWQQRYNDGLAKVYETMPGLQKATAEVKSDKVQKATG